MNYDYPLVMLSLPVLALLTAYGVWKGFKKLFRWVRRVLYQCSIVVLSQFTYVRELQHEIESLSFKLVRLQEENALLTDMYLVKTEKGGQMKFTLPTENKPYIQKVTTKNGTIEYSWKDSIAYQSHMQGKIPVIRNGVTMWVTSVGIGDEKLELKKFYFERKI